MLEVPVVVEVVFDEVVDGRATRMIVTVDDGEPAISTAYRPINADAEYLAAFVGRYHSNELDAGYELSVIDGILSARGPDRELVPLLPGIADVFTTAGVSVGFTRDGGAVDGFVLDAGRVRGIRFERE